MNLIEIARASEGTAETATGASDGILGSMGINAPLFIFQLLNFAIVFVILWFLILKPLSKKLTERQKMIDDSIDNSKKIEDILKQSEKTYQERMDVAKAEANTILEQAKIEADMVAEEIKRKSKNDIDEMVNQAKTRINAEKESTIAGIRKEAAGLIVAAAEKILKEKIDLHKDKQIIAEALDQFDYEKK